MEWENKTAAAEGLEVAFPFLDRDLLAFLLAVPGQVQTAGGVPKALVREGLADLLPESIARRTWKADFSEAVNAGLRREHPRLVTRLAEDGRAARRGWVNSDVVRREVARLGPDLDGPACATAWSLSDLAGLEAWTEVFLEPDRGAPARRPTGRSPSVQGDAA